MKKIKQSNFNVSVINNNNKIICNPPTNTLTTISFTRIQKVKLSVVEMFCFRKYIS